jgi:hypothetical protein
MRQMISGLAAAIAVVTVSAAPALACGGLFTGSSSCGQAYVSPCAQGCGTGYGAGYGYAGAATYDRLPGSGHHPYYYVNQGPTYTGPGQFAPYPTYQETAISGWRNYERGVDTGYDGGPYGNATNHYSDAQPYYRGPAIYSYRHFRARPSYRYGVSLQPRVRYGYAHRGYAPRYGVHHYRFAGPRMTHAPHYAMPHHGYGRPLKRMY